MGEEAQSERQPGKPPWAPRGSCPWGRRWGHRAVLPPDLGDGVGSWPPRRGRVPAECHPASEGRQSLRAGGLCTQGRVCMGSVARCSCSTQCAGHVAESPACTCPQLASPGLLSVRTVQLEQAGGQAFLQ